MWVADILSVNAKLTYCSNDYPNYQESAGGSQSTCSGVAVPAFTSLLAEGGVCDQQNAADSMIDLAKQLGNDPEMIRLAQIFVQQPRNAVRSKLGLNTK